jgi:hypothetical protein
MARTFFTQRLDVPPPQPTEQHATRGGARLAAKSHTALGGGRRVAVYTVSGSTQEFFYQGVMTHHYTRSGRCVIDDRAAYQRELALNYGERVAQSMLDAIEAGRAR